jgi:hypothetical protein
MAKIRKHQTTTDTTIYEVELTEEQLTIYNEDEDRFIDEIADELDWDYLNDDAGDPDIEYELVD